MKPGEPVVPDEFTDELIRETAVAQGLPFFVEDESALDRFATLMAHANPGLASATPRSETETPAKRRKKAVS